MDTHDAHDHIHPEPQGFIAKYIISYDHKVIAKQFIWAAFVFLFVGGFLAMLIRWQWAYPGQPIPVVGKFLFPYANGAVPASYYMKLFTMHGTIMIFFAITPLLGGMLPNYVIPLMIGARDMAFPWLNMLSFWTFVVAGTLALASFFAPLGPAGAGWTAYAPLSTNVGTPGAGQTLILASLFVTGLSSIMGGINYITTVIRMRAPGMGYMQMPLTIWGLWLTAILNVLFVPVLGSAGLLDILDRTMGTEFFIAGASAVNGGGDPLAFQHLFWIFGHPEVYILILPAWGVASDVISFFSRKPAFLYKASVYSMCAVSILSALVYGHHMFVTGMNPLLGKSFMTFTFFISVPAEVLTVNWLNTLWKGSIRLATPMLFAMGLVFVFTIGGLTGIYLGTMSTDLYFHDTMWVVGHFHFTMAAASLLGAFCAIYFWFPKMFGRMMNETLGKIHFWITVPGLTLVFGGQLVAGWNGQQRRLYNPFEYTYTQHLHGVNIFTSMFAFALFFGQFIFLANFLYSMVRGQIASDNPWEVGTLEWGIPSPAPYYNFKTIPRVYHGPHEFSNPEFEKILGRDWVMQTEEIPSTTSGGAQGTGHIPAKAHG